MNFEMGTRQSDRGIFDRLLGWADRLRSENQYPFGLEEQITTLERILQDIDNEEITQSATRKLTYWLEIVTQIGKAEADSELEIKGKSKFQYAEVVDNFQHLSMQLIDVLILWDGPQNAKSVLAKVNALEPNPPSDWEPDQSLSPGFASKWNVLRRAKRESLRRKSRLARHLDGIRNIIGGHIPYKEGEKIIDILKSDQPASAKKISSHINDAKFDASSYFSERPTDLAFEPSFVWQINIKFLDDSPKASQIGFTIWSIAASLEQIDGVNVHIISWGHGSLWAQFSVWIKDVWARDEVKETLKLARESAEAEFHGKKVHESEKLQFEAEKLKKETQALEKSIQNSQSKEEATLQRRQDQELKELEIEHKKVDLSLKRLEAIKTASKLISDGLVQADKIEIDINQLLFLSRDAKEFNLGQDIEDIAKAETVLDPQDDDGGETTSSK